MENSSILGTTLHAIDDVLQETALGQSVKFLNESGCSLFFITSSIASMVTGNKNRARALENEESDIAFKKELQRQKEQFEDAQDSADMEFKLRMKLLQRRHSREQNYEKFHSDQKKSQLEMFFNIWPLASSVGGLQSHIHNSPIFASPFNIVLGRVQIENDKDPLYHTYKDPNGTSNGITDIVIDTLANLGISKEYVHLVNESCQLYGGALFANVYAVMHSLPTIVISPVVYERKVHISIGCWNQDSSFPYQDEVLVFDYDSQKALSNATYREGKIKEFIQSIVAVSAVFNETYLLSEGLPAENKYPLYAEKMNIAEDYPYIRDFAVKEYKSLLANPQSDLFVECDSIMSRTSVLGNKHFEKMETQILTFINPLNH